MKKQSFEDTLSRYAREAKFVVAKEDLPEDDNLLDRLDVYLLQTPSREEEVKELYAYVEKRVKELSTSIILVKCDCCDPVLEACHRGLPVMNMSELFISLARGSFCQYDKDKDRYVFSDEYALPNFPPKLSIKDDFVHYIGWSSYLFRFYRKEVRAFIDNLLQPKQPRLF